MPIMETGQEDVGEAAVTRNEARRTSSDLANRDELLAATLLAETRAGDGNPNEVKWWGVWTCRYRYDVKQSTHILMIYSEHCAG